MISVTRNFLPFAKAGDNPVTGPDQNCDVFWEPEPDVIQIDDEVDDEKSCASLVERVCMHEEEPIFRSLCCLIWRFCLHLA